MEKRLNLWIHEITDKKRVVDSIVVRLKAKEVCSHVTQGQKNAKPSWLVLAGLRGSRVGITGEASSADQEAVEEFLNVNTEEGYVEEEVFKANATGLFYKDLGKQTYIT